MTRSPMALLDQVPALKPLLLLAGLALSVAIGISLFMWSRGPDWTALSMDMDAREMSAARSQLEGAGISTRIGPDAGVLSVPRTQIHEARLLLAGANLASGSGFDMLAESPGFGVSQFMESARYQYALETELARTIGSLAPVRAARVHIAVARDSAFVRDNRRASASVVVDLRPGRRLDQQQAQAIVNLVASSVPQLDAERVTVVDANGNLLSGREGRDNLESAERSFELARETEALLATRIEGLLVPMLGEGRVRAQVTVEYDNASSEEARERVDADPRAIRSERVREETARSSQGGGPAGAAANMPDNPDAAQGTGGDDADVRSRDVSREFALGRELAYTRLPPGRLKRVSAAVLIDHVADVDDNGTSISRPLTEPELDRIRRLVEGAIGFDEVRGDRLWVDNSRFVSVDPPMPPDSAPMWERMIDDGWLQMAARNIGGVIVLLVLIFAVLRPTLRTLLQPVRISVDDEDPALRPALAGPPLSTEDDESLPALAEAPYQKKLQLARKAVQDDPKRVAQLVRHWVSSDG